MKTDTDQLKERLGDIETAEAKVKIEAAEWAARKEHAAEGKSNYETAIAELRTLCTPPDPTLFMSDDEGGE